MEQAGKSSFFLKNLAKGLVWLAVIVALFVFSKHNINQDTLARFEPLFTKTFLILSIFTFSELIIGIIPPEVFMIWSLRSGDLNIYIWNILLLTVISYLAGVAAYLFGRYLHNTRLYAYLHDRYLQKSEKLLYEYGLYLILVAALTPVPFSGVAMLVGSVKFALSAWIIWEANML
jgi:membrane protein YqaA with SNARE-associated domain